MNPIVAIALVLAICTLSSSAEVAERRPSGKLSLPTADGVIQSMPHEQVQWWYYTGFLRTNDTSASSTPDYGFEICTFLVENDMQMVQVAITDVKGQTFTFKENIEVKHPSIMDNSFEFSSPIGSISGGDGKDSLEIDNAPFKLKLDLQSIKPAAIHYGGEKHSYDFGGYTYYYSRTKMNGSGSLTAADGSTLSVREYVNM